MIYLLFVILIVGLFCSFVLTNRNLLSCTLLGHVFYLISTSVLVLNYKEISYDISFATVLLIEGTLICLGFGEFIGNRLVAKKNTSQVNSNNFPKIIISRSKYIICLFFIVINSFYQYFKFNYVGSVLGGGDFISKYMLVRSYLTTEDDVRGIDTIPVPYSSLFFYSNFIATAIVYTLLFTFFYLLFFKKIRDNRLIYAVLVHIPVLVLSTTRSIFINTISISSIIIFLVFLQSHKNRNVSGMNKKILKWSLYALILFETIFVGVGNLKEQDVISNASSTITSYAGASIIGLDQYIIGKVKSDSDYPGQVTLEGLVSFLNHFGFDHKLATYHQDNFYYGHSASNIFSAPYYMLRDFPFIIVLLIHIFWGVIISYYISKVRKFKVPQYLPYNYILVGYLYYPIVMISITDAFRHIISIPFVYTLFFLFIVQKLIIKKSIVT